MAGFNTRGSVRWLSSSRNSPSGSGANTPAQTPWGNGGLTPTPAQAAAAVANAAGSAVPMDYEGEGVLGKKKGKKAKKGETLFHFG